MKTGLTPEEVAKEVHDIQTCRWPLSTKGPMLCVKSFPRDQEVQRFGRICRNQNGEPKPTVYVGNLSLEMDGEFVVTEEKAYETLEALIEDGWVVD